MNLIPKDRHEDVLHMYWQLLLALEGRVSPNRDPWDRQLVEAAYQQLNQLGYTKNRAAWDVAQVTS